MIYFIDDKNQYEIEITDTVRVWTIPKFRIIMNVEEPYLYLRWNDREGGDGGDVRLLTIDYRDVVDGYAGYISNPSSATDLETSINAMIISGWTNLVQGDILTAKADLLSHDGVSDTILPGGANESILSRDNTEAVGLKWIAKTSVTVPGGSSGQMQYNNSGAMGGTALPLQPYYMLAGNTNFVDSATYYFSNSINNVGAGSTANMPKIWFRQAGTIKKCDLEWYALSTIGSGENVSIYIRLNNTTDYLVATVGDTNREKTFSNTAMSVPIASGDYIHMAVVTPAWATNPVQVVINGYALFEATP